MKAFTATDRDAGAEGLTLTDLPHPHAAENDVVVRVHAAGFTPRRAHLAGHLDRPRGPRPHAERARARAVRCRHRAGLRDHRPDRRPAGLRPRRLDADGSLAEYTAVEARNLAPLAADIGHTVAAALPISGLTAWQGLFDHAGLATGQTVLIHGAAGAVGSIAVQLARDAGARVIGTGRDRDRDVVLGLGAHGFRDPAADGEQVDVVFDVLGGDVLAKSAALVRPGGTLVTIAEPPTVRPADGRAVFFVVEPDRGRLADLARRVRDGRLELRVGEVRPFAEAADAFAHRRVPGKTIIRVAAD